MRYIRAAIIAFLLVVVLFAVSAQVGAKEIAEGVSVQVIATYPSNVAGVKAVKLIKFTMQPGAVLKDFTIKTQGYWTSTKGTVTVVAKGKGSAKTYAQGSRWVSEKGSTVTLTNTGDGVHVHYVYQLVEN